jgi:D-glycerate 3-kinase
MPGIIDDKSEHCVPFIIDRIKEHREAFESKGEKPTPFFVGLNGVQDDTGMKRARSPSHHSHVSQKQGYHPQHTIAETR